MFMCFTIVARTFVFRAHREMKNQKEEKRGKIITRTIWQRWCWLFIANGRKLKRKRKTNSKKTLENILFHSHDVGAHGNTNIMHHKTIELGKTQQRRSKYCITKRCPTATNSKARSHSRSKQFAVFKFSFRLSFSHCFFSFFSFVALFCSACLFPHCRTCKLNSARLR